MKQPKYLTTDKLKVLLDSPSRQGEMRDKVILDLMAFCLLREAEVTHLKVQDFDFDSHVIRLKFAKGDKPREVPIQENSEQLYKTYIKYELKDKKTGYMFPSREKVRQEKTKFYKRKNEERPKVTKDENNDYSISENTVYNIVRKYAKASGIITKSELKNSEMVERSRKNPFDWSVTPHSLRHSGARALSDDGVPVEIIKDMLGHERLDTTIIYLRRSEQEAVKIVREHDWRNKNETSIH